MENTGKMITLQIKKNGKFVEEKQYKKGTLLADIAKEYDDDSICRILVANTGNRIVELHKRLDADSGYIDFLTAENFHGYRCLERALIFIFVRTVCEICGVKTEVKIEHSLDKGLYCEITPYIGWLDEEMLKKIKERMQNIIEADEKFEKFNLPLEDAKKMLSEQHDKAKIDLLNYRDKDTANIYRCGWLWDYFYGPLPMSTGCATVFDLMLLGKGILLRLPNTKNPRELPTLKHDRMMREIFKESHRWMDLIEIPYVAQLNQTIENDTYRKIIQVSEALHEKKIAQIADGIATMKKRIILIAGPSSSGKTSFAQRLAVQLNVHGIKTCTLSTDDYFVDREFVEKDEEGNYKFEDLEAVDTELFNEQLNSLLAGEEVQLPVYDFIKGEKIFGKRSARMGLNDTIIIEGIHGMNDKLTERIRAKDKFKIYVSPLTALGIDAHNRISTSDARLFRRIVRDYRTRGKSAKATLATWKDVRAGEEKNIFPFQEEADVMFNSALPYELAVLKKYAQPLLEQVTQDEPEYLDSRRLLKLLSYFLELPDEQAILNNSLLKEFIGGTCLFED